MEEVKQVIVMRKDLKMRRGKEIAQGGHAVIAWLVERGQGPTMFSEEETLWITNGLSTIVCLQVSSEQELVDVYEKACQAKLIAHLITDAGLTEFAGVPTKTCCAIGPDDSASIDLITGHLKLY